MTFLNAYPCSLEEVKCRDPDLHWGRQAFQACALLPELSRQFIILQGHHCSKVLEDVNSRLCPTQKQNGYPLTRFIILTKIFWAVEIFGKRPFLALTFSRVVEVVS